MKQTVQINKKEKVCSTVAAAGNCTEEPHARHPATPALLSRSLITNLLKEHSQASCTHVEVRDRCADALS